MPTRNDLLERLLDCEGFDWDSGNADKVWLRHRVSTTECEELFLNRPLIVEADATHSYSEERLYALGSSDAGRLLFVAFTIHGHFIRIISARDMSRQERRMFKLAI